MKKKTHNIKNAVKKALVLAHVSSADNPEWLEGDTKRLINQLKRQGVVLSLKTPKKLRTKKPHTQPCSKCGYIKNYGCRGHRPVPPSPTEFTVPRCKGYNYHVFTLGADTCSICGWDRYK